MLQALELRAEMQMRNRVLQQQQQQQRRPKPLLQLAPCPLEHLEEGRRQETAQPQPPLALALLPLPQNKVTSSILLPSALEARP